MRFRSDLALSVVAGAALGLGGLVSAARAEAPRLVVQAIDELQTVALPGNVRAEAQQANDRGPVADDFRLEHMQLLLARPAETEAALGAFIDRLHDPASPLFHHWIDAAQFGQSFGPATADVDAVVGWLQGHGFRVDTVQPGRMMIDFSGTAAQVRQAFHTEIHTLDVQGARHIANMANPRVPAALAGVVRGVVSLHDFRPHTNFQPRPAYTFKSNGETLYAVVPADLATIYNFNPLFAAGISGQGQTIAVIEDTNVYSLDDWTRFRSVFGLSGYTSGSLVQVHPAPASGANNCRNPGVLPGNEGEATLDAEWASAGAPSAAIQVASCADTATTFGGLIALQNLLASPTPPAVVSISYGECEVQNGATANAAYNTIYQQAVAAGVSVFVSSGDEGAASCDANQSVAAHGIAVSGFASTPYNVAVGGTDFGDTYAKKNSTYWSAKNGAAGGSAKSYIPEIPWNDSCASTLIATTEGFKTSYGTDGFCNSTQGADFLTTASGSGGPSKCATGFATINGVVSGTCKGYAKPAWQHLLGVPADGVRDIPDVSLFAANGVWGHYFIYCDSDASDQETCTGAPSAWSGAGGTSFSAPIVAAIQALVNQKTGSSQGNPNPTLYALAKAEYGKTGSAICGSSLGVKADSGCLFYDVTQGDMDVNCTGTHDCYLPSGKNGVLSTSSTQYLKAYGARKGWDFATGIGTLNAANLVNNW